MPPLKHLNLPYIYNWSSHCGQQGQKTTHIRLIASFICDNPVRSTSTFSFSASNTLAFSFTTCGYVIMTLLDTSYVSLSHLDGSTYVGKELKQFIIPMDYLNYHMFKALLEKVEEEFGFNHKGALTLPYDPVVFEHLTWMLAKYD
jgi:hypothetical protein